MMEMRIAMLTATSFWLLQQAFLFVTYLDAARSSKVNVQAPSRGRHGLDKEEDRVCELEINCKNNDLKPVHPIKLPIRGPTGPPGQPGQKGDDGEDGIPGIPGLSGLSAPTPARVAFFVGLSGNMGPVKENTVILFDRVITNIGGSYDVRNGRFTAPVNGTFQFSVSMAAQGRQKAGVMLVRNSSMVATVWAESIPSWGSSSNIAILSLERGEQVWLLLLNRASYLHGYMYTTFSGFLIFEN